MGKRKSMGELFEVCHFDREISWTATQHPIGRQIAGVTTLRPLHPRRITQMRVRLLMHRAAFNCGVASDDSADCERDLPRAVPIYLLNPPSIPLSENLDSSDTDMH